MTFKKYNKIHRLGAEENVGILMGTCHIQEKIDGANTSIWMEDGEIKCGSRTQPLEGGFRGFVDYVRAHEGIKELLRTCPDIRLYGEWLVRHTISYDETKYNEFYLFDIEMREEFTTQNFVYTIASQHKINTPQLFATLESPKLEDLETYVGRTNLGDKGEGIVIKNPDFVNQFGDHVYAKMVTQEFKEDNAIVFGGNNKYSDTYVEMYIVNKYMSLARVQKIMNKLQPIVDKKLDMEHTGRVINTAYHDMITEEMWDIIKKHKKIDFGALGKLSMRKAARIYHDILNNHVSVAYEEQGTNDKSPSGE